MGITDVEDSHLGNPHWLVGLVGLVCCFIGIVLMAYCNPKYNRAVYIPYITK